MAPVVEPLVDRTDGHEGVDGCSIANGSCSTARRSPRYASDLDMATPEQGLVVTVGARVDPVGVRGRMKVLHGRHLEQYSRAVAAHTVRRKLS